MQFIEKQFTNKMKTNSILKPPEILNFPLDSENHRVTFCNYTIYMMETLVQIINNMIQVSTTKM